MVSWWRLCLALQGLWVLIPGRGTKSPHAGQGVTKKKTDIVTTLQFSKNKCADHLLLGYYTGKLEDFSTKWWRKDTLRTGFSTIAGYAHRSKLQTS